MRLLIITCSLLSVLLCACSHSPRKNYFILNATAVNSEKHSNEEIDQLIGIGPIEIADYIDRLPILYTQSDNTLVIAENDYWAEPLNKGIARVIADNLGALNPKRSFTNFPWRMDNKPTYSLRLQVHNLSCNSKEASIDASWELINNITKISLQRRHFIRSVPAQANPKALTQAYNKLLGDLALEMDMLLKSTSPP